MKAQVVADSQKTAEERGLREDIFKLGEVLSDTYEIRGTLGEGGMGQVFEAHDLLLNRKVAIKAHWLTLRQFSLRKEAQALAAVRHPAMVTVYAIGKHREIEYLVMENVPGIAMSTYLEQRQKVADRFTLREPLDILIAIADGLAAVHRAGIAHRDVKPANILLAPGDRIVLTDFGLVTPEFDLETKAAVAGTPSYMAPEAFSNQVEPGASNLLDTYAFGIVAFELLCGTVPYPGENTLQVMFKHVSEPIPRVDEQVAVPARLSDLICELMAKDPRERPQSLEAVAGQLRSIRSSLAHQAPEAPLSVLIIDDTPDIARLMSMYVKLGAPNAEVQIAAGAKVALEMVRKKPPSLIVLDLQMPEMSGVEFFLYLRGARLCEDCTVIAVSASASDADRALLNDLGIGGFIPKGPELRARLTSLVRAFAGTPRVPHKAGGPTDVGRAVEPTGARRTGPVGGRT